MGTGGLQSGTYCLLSHREAVLKGLEYFGQTKLDFVDCMGRDMLPL